MDFTHQEIALLDELLHDALKHLRLEIHRTDSITAKTPLREREALLSEIVGKIDATGLHGSQPVEPAAARPKP